MMRKVNCHKTWPIIDVTPKNINKRNMKIKFSDGEFVLYGPWEMEIK